MTTLRELKYVLLGDDRLSNKLNGVSRSGYKATEALKGHSEKLATLRDNFKNAADEIPGLNSGLAMLSNPLVLGAAGAVGLAVGIRNATREARLFNSTFRELANLNLDKSFEEIKTLKTLVRNVAFDKGFDQNQTSKAFFDVQSVSGKYGGEVAKIVEQQGEFANVFKADFNSWIAGTAKAMANYGFGTDKLQEFNKVSYATYLTAAMTFDELAKVQSVYAGAAAGARQSFSSANKMLTLFTLTTKSADEAATQTKSLFTDFTKQTTIDAFKKVGISIFDNNNKIKQADKLIVELNSKFRQFGTNDKNLMNLKNQFMGSEGLIAFVQQATDQSGALLEKLASFDYAELGFNKALKMAREDTDYINNQLKNRTKILMSEIGEMFIPIQNKGADILNGGVRYWFDHLAPGKRGTEKGNTDAIKGYDYLMYNAAKMPQDKYDNEMAVLRERRKKAESDYTPYRGHESDYLNPEVRYNANYYSSYLSKLIEIGRLADEFRAKGYTPLKPGEKITPEPGSGLDDKTTNGLNSVAGGGNAIRNITVNIQKLIETQQINTQNLTEGTTQVQQLVEAALIRAVSGTEQMLAN